MVSTECPRRNDHHFLREDLKRLTDHAAADIIFKLPRPSDAQRQREENARRIKNNGRTVATAALMTKKAAIVRRHEIGLNHFVARGCLELQHLRAVQSFPPGNPNNEAIRFGARLPIFPSRSVGLRKKRRGDRPTDCEQEQGQNDRTPGHDESRMGTSRSATNV